MSSSRSKALLYRGTPEDGDVVVYNAATRKWEPQAPAGGDNSGASGAGSIKVLGPCEIRLANAQQQSDSMGGADGGTATLTVEVASTPHTTAAIAWNADGAAIKAALEALPAIGAGNATITGLSGNDPTLTDGFAVVFAEDLVITALLTGNAASLTGTFAPYTYPDFILGPKLAVEMWTPAEGDVVLNFIHRTVTPSASSDTRLYYTDSPATPNGGGAWTNPSDGQGVHGLELDLAEGDYTNFSGNGSLNAPQAQPDVSTALFAEAIINADGTMYTNIPAVVLNAVPIYSYIVYDNGEDAIDAEVWVYAVTSTPDSTGLA